MFHPLAALGSLLVDPLWTLVETVICCGAS